MQLITTHLGADFDGLASMLAARRLYPQAKLFFPGSREASVRRMLAARGVEIEEVRSRDVDPSTLERIVLCDTRQRARLGVAAEWIARYPRVEVIAFDHHPDGADDIPASAGRVDSAVGALSTLMLEELRAAGLVPTPAEREALLLGVYEDTGSLTYATTTARDLLAAAWLLEQGADLSLVRRFVSPRLDIEHLDVLHRMAAALEVHRAGGHRLGIVALELSDHIEELAPLVSRCLELFDLRVLVALFLDAGRTARITAIGRGDVPGLDLGALFRRVCGGGGHATAAAGSLRERTLVQAQELFLEALREGMPPGLRAGDLMLRQFHALAPETTIADGRRQLLKWQVNAAPVVDSSGRVQGVVSRLALDSALQHAMGSRPVEIIQDGEPTWVSEDTSAEELARRFAGRGPRTMLVGEAAAGRAQGIVTRMMVLRGLYGSDGEHGEGAAGWPVGERRERHQAVARMLDQRLQPRLRLLLREVAGAAREAGVPVFLVGGLVRDLLLGRENRDVDLVVVGDGAAFARRCAVRVGGTVRLHGAFLTATLLLEDGLEIDIASARSDFYRAPAALPEVQGSALRQDLLRRDFTVNTLAIRLGPESEPELVDFFGGRRDLEDRVLRVLHSLSFIDDPTRAFRAVRLEKRLGFALSGKTVRLLHVARSEGAFDALSGSRLCQEVLLTLAESSTAIAALERWAELGLLSVLDPELGSRQSAPGEVLRERLSGAVAALDWYRLEGLAPADIAPGEVLLAALAESLDEAGRQRFATRLMLQGAPRELVLSLPRREMAATGLLAVRSLSEASELMSGLSASEVLLILASAVEPVLSWARRELAESRRLILSIGGRELLASGVEPGPEVGAALRLTRAARLDGMIGVAEELEFALRAARTGGAR